MLSVFSCAHWPFVYLLWRNVYLRIQFLLFSDSTNCGSCSTVVFTIEKKICISGPIHFKPVLFKCQLFQYAQTMITKYHRLGGLNNRYLFSHSSGGWKSKIKVLENLVSGEDSLLDLYTVTFSLCPHMAFPLCVSSSYDTSCIGSRLHLMTLFNLNYFHFQI